MRFAKACTCLPIAACKGWEREMGLVIRHGWRDGNTRCAEEWARLMVSFASFAEMFVKRSQGWLSDAGNWRGKWWADRGPLWAEKDEVPLSHVGFIEPPHGSVAVRSAHGGTISRDKTQDTTSADAPGDEACAVYRVPSAADEDGRRGYSLSRVGQGNRGRVPPSVGRSRRCKRHSSAAAICWSECASAASANFGGVVRSTQRSHSTCAQIPPDIVTTTLHLFLSLHVQFALPV